MASGKVAEDGVAVQRQRVIVMRHGARLDSADPTWEHNAGKERPYDTPLTEPGKQEAYRIATNRYKNLGISVVVSSPFLRCLQTAQEACRSLGLSGIITDNRICEVLAEGSKMKTPPTVPVADVTSQGIAIVKHGDKPLPQFPETVHHALNRYLTVIPLIANEYYPSNVLIVTHQYGVEQAATLALGTSESYEASYCGHVVLLRDSQDPDCKWTLESKFKVDAYTNLMNDY